MNDLKEKAAEILPPETFAQLFGQVEKLAIQDKEQEKRLVFATLVLLLGDSHPSAAVAMGVAKSIEDTDLFAALALLGQALPELQAEKDVNQAISSVIGRGLREYAQLLSNKSNNLEKRSN